MMSQLEALKGLFADSLIVSTNIDLSKYIYCFEVL